MDAVDRDPLEGVRQADHVWRTTRAMHQNSSRARLEAVQAANTAGCGYGRIAVELGVSKAMVQQMCNQGREDREVGVLGERETLPEEQSGEEHARGRQEARDDTPGSHGDAESSSREDESCEGEEDMPAFAGGIDTEKHASPPFCKHGLRWGKCCS